MKDIEDYLDELEDLVWNHSDSYKINNIRNKINDEIKTHLDLKKIDYTDKIRKWAIERNLHNQDSSKQLLKLMEEVGELASGMIRDDNLKIIDSIGDIYVVLVVLAMQEGLQIEDCIEAAYMEIKDRTGKIVNGSYIKESDLKENEKCS